MTRRLVIRGGLVVTPSGVRKTDIALEGERVAGLGSFRGRQGDDIDAEGCYVLPGGIDPHTHLLADVASATRSAAFGGTTTAVCFTNPTSGEPAAEAVVRGRDEVKRHAEVDVALHAILGGPGRLTRQDLDKLPGL